MARLTDTLRAALGYWWDLVNGAAQQGFTVTETVQLANGIASDLGQNLRPDENRAISQLYGYARRIINAGTAFQRADPSQGITGDMISQPPWAREQQEMNTYPTWNVKFEYVYIDQAGNKVTSYRTSVFNDTLPATVGELTADVLDDAEAMANKYGHTLLSATPLQIMAV